MICFSSSCCKSCSDGPILLIPSKLFDSSSDSSLILVIPLSLLVGLHPARSFFFAFGSMLVNLVSMYPFCFWYNLFRTFSPERKLTLLFPRKEIRLILKFCFFKADTSCVKEGRCWLEGFLGSTAISAKFPCLAIFIKKLIFTFTHTELYTSHLYY